MLLRHLQLVVFSCQCRASHQKEQSNSCHQHGWSSKPPSCIMPCDAAMWRAARFTLHIAFHVQCHSIMITTTHILCHVALMCTHAGVTGCSRYCPGHHSSCFTFSRCHQAGLWCVWSVGVSLWQQRCRRGRVNKLSSDLCSKCSYDLAFIYDLELAFNMTCPLLGATHCKTSLVWC